MYKALFLRAGYQATLDLVTISYLPLDLVTISLTAGRPSVSTPSCLRLRVKIVGRYAMDNS